MCADKCDLEKKSCVDSDEVTTINSCIMDCARLFDTGMKKCVSQVSATARSTFGNNLDSCSIKASSKMDVCKDDCIGIEDYKLNGWKFPDDMEEVQEKFFAYKNLAYEDWIFVWAFDIPRRIDLFFVVVISQSIFSQEVDEDEDNMGGNSRSTMFEITCTVKKNEKITKTTMKAKRSHLAWIFLAFFPFKKNLSLQLRSQYPGHNWDPSLRTTWV